MTNDSRRSSTTPVSHNHRGWAVSERAHSRRRSSPPIGQGTITGSCGYPRRSSEKSNPGPAPFLSRQPVLALRLCSTILLAISVTVGAGTEITKSEDPFVVLTQHVANAGLLEQQDFAWIAVSELIAAYDKVIAESSQERPGALRERRRLSDWRAGVRAFNRELSTLMAALESGADIEIQPGGAGAAVLFIGGSPLVISGPEIGAIGVMERRIITTYCVLHLCPDLSHNSDLPSGGPRYVGRGIWVLDNQRPPRYQTPDGLTFIFSNFSSRRDKQEFCEAVAGELRSLAEGLMRTRQHGLGIDWDRLDIRPFRGADGSHVTVNHNGDFLHLNLPYLERTDLLKRGGMAWVKARVNGQKEEASFEQAEQFMRSGRGD